MDGADDENLEDEEDEGEEKKRKLLEAYSHGKGGIEEVPQEGADEEGSPYGQKQQAWSNKLNHARKQFGKQPGKGLGRFFGKGAGGAGGAGKAGGAAARAAVAALGPWGIALIGILIVVLILALVFWGMLGGKSSGQTPHVQASQSTINEFLAFTGDAIQLRKLIVEKGDELKTELARLNTTINTVPNLSDAKKEDAKEKIDEMIILIGNAKDLLSGTGDQISTAANDKIKQIQNKIGELQKAVNMTAVSPNGELFLPLGPLTCVTYTKKGDRHTAIKSGHGVWLKWPNPPATATKFGALDWYAANSTTVYAIADGTIESIYRMHPRWKNYGFRFKSSDGKYVAVYQHLARSTLSLHQQVTKGQPLGQLLKGDMSSPHLHFELWVGGYPDGNPLVEQGQRNFLCGGG